MLSGARPGARAAYLAGNVALMCYIAAVTLQAVEDAMSTTTIRLTEELKARIARAAERAGTTPHGFILEAIAEKAEAQEHRDEMHDLAEQRYARIVASGETIDWSDMRSYLQARAAGRPASAPKPRKLGR